MTKSFTVLHERAIQISKSYLKAESDLIAILQQIDDCRGYREVGHKSLFDYATQALGLSESVTYNLITIARKSREVPKLQEMIRDQAISASNARMIAPVLTSQNQEKWLSAAASMSKRVLEKEIAKEHPKALVQEQTRFVSETRLELKLGISEKLHDKLKRVQDLVSSRDRTPADLERCLEELIEFYLKKNDPIEKTKPQPVPGQAKALNNPRYIPAQIKRAVLLRDKNQCSFISSNGTRCSERRWLDIHHVRPLSDGGQTCFENLKLICRGHHQMLHH